MSARFAITYVRRVWYVVDTSTGARVSGGTYRRDAAVADALKREQLLGDADALRRCTGAVAVTYTDDGITVTARDD